MLDKIQRRLEIVKATDVIHQQLPVCTGDERGLGLKNAV
jgi:hypothetical protein